MGADPTKFKAADIGHDPQFLLGYPVEMSVERNSNVTIAYASGLWGTGKHLSQITIVDAVTGKVIKQKRFESAKHAIGTEKCNAWHNGGCGFSSTIEVSTTDLEVSSYYAFLTDENEHDSHPIFFNIRPSKVRSKDYDVLFVYPEFTWAAYNRFGGGSLYSMHGFGADGRLKKYEYSRTRAYSASLQRPMLVDPEGKRKEWTREIALRRFTSPEDKRFSTELDVTRVPISKEVLLPNRLHGNKCDLRSPDAKPCANTRRSPYWIQRFDESPDAVLPAIRELRAAGYKVAAITQRNINLAKGVLDDAKVVVFHGHHEYWTKAEFDKLLNYVRRGGAIANFAGNVYWGRVNFIGEDIYFDQLHGIRGVKGACDGIIPKQFSGTGFLGISQFPASERLLGLAYRYGGYPIPEYHWAAETRLEKI